LTQTTIPYVAERTAHPKGKVVLFENEARGERWPVFSGSIEIDGVKRKIALWPQSRPTKFGRAWFSGTIDLA
jgi:hypothetical protein